MLRAVFAAASLLLLTAAALPPADPAITATGSTSGRTGAQRAAQQVNVKDYGAVGDGVADDSAAISAAVARVNALFAASPVVHACIYFPAGQYRVVSSLTTFSLHNPGCILGDATHHSYIMVDNGYAGDMFAWDDAIFSGATGTWTVSQDTAGPTIKDITVIGNTSAASQQNAFVFYDRNDHIHMENVDVFFLNGRAISFGRNQQTANAYARESYFNNLTLWYCGTSSLPCLEIDAQGTGDTSKQLNFYGVNVFSPTGPGVVIRNENTNKAVSQIRFYGFRVENGGAGDLLQIGDTSSTYSGKVADITFYGAVFNASNASFASVGLYAPTGASQPYGIKLYGNIPTGNGVGLNIQAGRQLQFDIGDISTTGTDLVVGSSSLVGAGVVVNANNLQGTWTTSIDATSAASVLFPAYMQSPGNIIAGPKPDSTTVGGNNRGSQATDLQVSRSNAAMVASGANSAIGGGLNNTASGGSNVVAGGQQNTTNGPFAVIPGGRNANDRSLYGSECMASGDFAVQGDAQRCIYTLRGATSNTSAVVLTGDGAAAGATNCINVPTLTGYALHIDVEAFDHTTVGNNEAWIGWAGKIHRPSNAASTTVVMAAAPTPLTSGTVTGSSISATADTTNGCLAISFTPPTGNSDAWRVVATVQTTQVQ